MRSVRGRTTLDSTRCRREGPTTVAPTPLRGPALRPLYVGLLAAFLAVFAGAVLVLSTYDSRSRSSAKVLQGSGVSVTQARSLPPFTAIDLAGENEVIVHVGGRQGVEVQADANLIERVETEVVSGALVIATRGSFSAETPMRVDVTVPSLGGVTLTGTGAVRIEGVAAPRFQVRLLGTGLVIVSGTVDRLKANLAGIGDAQLQDLVARDVVATVPGDGRLQVHATRSLHASVAGTGAVFYTGNPTKVTQDVTGTGAIIKQ